VFRRCVVCRSERGNGEIEKVKVKVKIGETNEENVKEKE
jgi:hypothetical protein